MANQSINNLPVVDNIESISQVFQELLADVEIADEITCSIPLRNMAQGNGKEAWLQLNQEHFRQAVLSISDHIYVTEVTKEGQCLNLYLSPQVETLTGYPLERFKDNWDFWPSSAIHPDDRAIATAQAAKLAAGRDSNVEYRMIRADGQIIWVRDSGRVYHAELTASNIIYGVVSDITQRKHLQERLSTIYQLGHELILLRDEVRIFERVLETVVKVLQAEIAGYGLVDEWANELKYRYQLNHNRLEKINRRLPLSNKKDVGAAVIRSGQAINIANINQDTRYAPAPAAPAGCSWLSVPLRIGERIIGVLNVASLAPNYFTPDDRQLLQTLADQAVVAVENARLCQENEQQVKEMTAMNVISQTITSTLDLGKTLTIITDNVVHLLNVESASVALLDKSKGDLWFNATSGERADFMQDRRLPLEQGVVGWVVQHSEPALVPDASQDPRFFSDFDRLGGFTTRSILCFPLQAGLNTIGAIEVVNKRNGFFDQRDLRLLAGLAMPAAIAIENARLFEAQLIARYQAEALRDAISCTTSTLDLNHVLDSILLHLEQLVSYDQACIFLRNKEQLSVVAVRGTLPGQNQAIDDQYPIDNPLYHEIESTGRPLTLTNAAADPRFQGWREMADVRGWMGVPLITQNEVIGCLTLDSRKVAMYDQSQAIMVQTLANQAAVAIQNARLFKEVCDGRNRLQSLSHRLVQSQEFERRRVARELHDEAGQALSSLTVSLHLLERDASDPEAVIAYTTRLKRMTDAVQENLHRLAMDLRPSSLDHLGLVVALQQHIDIFSEQHDLTVQFKAADFGAKRLPSVVEINLYRIVQEALTNIARHAQATYVGISLDQRGDQIITIIEDNGLGFDVEAMEHSNRLGLLGMRERAEMLGGKLAVKSAVGTGTIIYVEVCYVYPNFNS